MMDERSPQEGKTKIVVLGGGPAGYAAAIRAARLGGEVTLIEDQKVGGVCLNIGCIPTKTLLETAKTAHSVKHAGEFGVLGRLEGVDWAAASRRRDRVVGLLSSGVAQLLEGSGVTVLAGRGEALSPRSVLVHTEAGPVLVHCERLILASGARPLLPPIPGLSLEGVLTSTQALGLTELPKSMAVIGGGVIGLEFASMLAPLGVKITVLELQDRIAPEMDEELAAELMKSLKRQGVAFRLGVRVEEITKADEGLSVRLCAGGKPQFVDCEKVLAAIGRKRNTECFAGLKLKLAGNAVPVNAWMETELEGVYAAGDLTEGRQLAHLAFAEGIAAAENALGGQRRVDGRVVPACVYTNPEAASVGMTEAEARAAGIPARVGRFSFRSNGRALSLGRREGFVKVLAAEDGTILGGQVLGAEASELIGELALAVSLRVKAEVLADLIHPHPSLSEAIWEACSDLLGRSIHKP